MGVRYLPREMRASKNVLDASDMKTSSALVEISNTLGIHLRPASNVVQVCNRYPNCDVELTKDGLTVNGRSIMSVIMLAAEKGSVLQIKVMGDECEDLLRDLIELIEAKFGEE